MSGRLAYREVTSLASSRDTLNGPDVQDVASALVHFEEQNQCRVILTIRSCGHGDVASVWWEAKAVSQPGGSQVPKLLACAQLSCGQLNLKRMSAATLSLLYMLDYELAKAEFDKAT